MPSRALIDWRTGACAAFDEIEHAHRAVGGTKPGRRFVTQQLNYAYVTLLAARFQGFARALHSETTDEIAAAADNSVHRRLLRESLTHKRALERQNAHPNSIGEDFARLGLDVWGKVDRQRRGNDQRRKKLWALITWRNAITHDDIDAKLTTGSLAPTAVSLATCRGWRSALNVLAISLDTVTADHCQTLELPRPW